MEGYIEILESGMKTVAKAAAKTASEIDQQWFTHAVLDGWDKSGEF